MFKEFDILFYRGEGLVSKLIQKITNSPFSHVCLILDNNHVVEIDWKYSLKINHLTYKSNKFDVYRLKDELTEEQKNTMRKFIYSTLDCKYDIVEIIDLFFGIKLNNTKNKFVCSSWINECFKSCGVTLSDNDLVSPQDLISDKIYRMD